MMKNGNGPKIGEPYIFKCGSDELRKILWYYGIINNVNESITKIICPFHEDVNPSMLVDLEEGKYFCFGCHKSGDALNFVLDVEQKKGLTKFQSLKKYFEVLNSEKVEKLKLGNIHKRKRKDNPTLLTMAQDYYYGLLTIDWCELQDDSLETCKKYMLRRGFKPSTLTKCKAKYTYNKNYELIFPMFDNKEFKGWVCRTTLKEVEQKRKYLYNEGFSRASTLVGKYGEKDWVIVVEGYMDRLKFLQCGQTNVVAILGWKCTSEQIDKLKKAGIKYIVSALDNEQYGEKGTKVLSEHFIVQRFKYIEGLKDPGDMSQKQYNKIIAETMKALKQLIALEDKHKAKRAGTTS